MPLLVLVYFVASSTAQTSGHIASHLLASMIANLPLKLFEIFINLDQVVLACSAHPVHLLRPRVAVVAGAPGPPR